MRQLERDDFFFPEGMGPIYTMLHERGLHLRGPSLKHLLTADRFTPSNGFLDRTTLLETEAVLALENTPGFPFSLTMAPGRKISEFLAGAAYDGDRLIAVASACNEVDGLWQIAVDVLPEARGTGLGLAIVSRVTTAILERDGLPYYSAASSNIASRSIAHRLGFWPVFTEMFTLESIEH
ncbi:MAG: GNAT family N-acetyltransferase [Thermomicrobiales bacterium]